MKYAILLVLLSITGNVIGQSSGPNSPASATYSFYGCLSCAGSEWNDPSNVFSPDSTGSTSLLSRNNFCFQSTCYFSRLLQAGDFGFSIPANAIITGIRADMVRKSGSFNSLVDSLVTLLSPSGFTGSNQAAAAFWDTSYTRISYGDSSDTWGMNLTPDSVNDSRFGVGLIALNKSAAQAAAVVDHVQLTIYYTTGTSAFSQSKSACGLFSIAYLSSHQLLVSGLCGAGLLQLMDAHGKLLLPVAVPNGAESIMLDLPVVAGGLSVITYTHAGKTQSRKLILQK